MTPLHPRGNVPARHSCEWRSIAEVIEELKSAQQEDVVQVGSRCWRAEVELEKARAQLQAISGALVDAGSVVVEPYADAVRELTRQRDEAVAHGEREPSIVVPTATWLEMVKEQDALSKTMRDLNDGCVELRAEAEREKARADKAEATLRAQLAETKTQAEASVVRAAGSAPREAGGPESLPLINPAMAPAYPGAPPVYVPLRARPPTAVVHKIAAEEPKPERVGLNPNTVMHSCVMCGAVWPRRAT